MQKSAFTACHFNRDCIYGTSPFIKECRLGKYLSRLSHCVESTFKETCLGYKIPKYQHPSDVVYVLSVNGVLSKIGIQNWHFNITFGVSIKKNCRHFYAQRDNDINFPNNFPYSLKVSTLLARVIHAFGFRVT